MTSRVEECMINKEQLHKLKPEQTMLSPNPTSSLMLGIVFLPIIYLKEHIHQESIQPTTPHSMLSHPLTTFLIKTKNF